MATAARQYRPDRGHAQPPATPLPDDSHQRTFFTRAPRLTATSLSLRTSRDRYIAHPALLSYKSDFKSCSRSSPIYTSIGGSLLPSAEAEMSAMGISKPSPTFSAVLRKKSIHREFNSHKFACDTQLPLPAHW